MTNPPELTDTSLDDLAYELAEFSRTIRRLRDELATLPETLDSFDQTKVAEARLIAEIEQTEHQRDACLTRLVKPIELVARQVALKCHADPQSIDEFIANSLSQVVMKIHFFRRTESQATEIQTAARSRFRGWLWAVLSRLFIDYLRTHPRTRDQKLISSLTDPNANSQVLLNKVQSAAQPMLDDEEDDDESVVRRSGGISASRHVNACEAVRPIPSSFTIQEEEQLRTLSDLCVRLFLFSTRTWPLLSEPARQRWPEGQASRWEMRECSSLCLVNRFATRLAEEEFQSFASQSAAISDAEFDACLKRVSRRVAQNLNRHFWKFLRLDTVWQTLFAAVQPFDDQFEQSMVEHPEIELVMAFLMADCEFRFSRSDCFFDLLESCGIQNTLDRNVGRIVGQSAVSPSDGATDEMTLNMYKWQLVCELVGVDSCITKPQLFLQSYFDDTCAERQSELMLQAVRDRLRVDLPIPFQFLKSAGSDESFNYEQP